LALASAVAGGIAHLIAQEEANPSADCHQTVEKDSFTWTKQGTGWIITIPYGQGTATQSVANYAGQIPQVIRTLNCSTNNWEADPT